ncbi:sulfotransferase domain-containing protein [Arcobacter peruensis]|uniref:sulfotransferase domain-containing protein n=1 Tax=Arcobacter peruensis TaxID=2320140 RepID=UPI0013DFA49F|nr:sulfotransferase domain-containing protein [Arcobacter peruensis]
MFSNIFKRKEKRTSNHIFENIIDDYDVIIHVGSPKTGTSAIQKFLLENKKKLEKEGYYYPDHGLDKNGISGGHSNLGIAISKDKLDEASEIFEEHILKSKKLNCKLLLSAESLFNHHEKLKKVTKNYKCKIVVFSRDPIETIFSNYNQSVKRHYQTLDINSICTQVLNQNNDLFSGRIFVKWCEEFDKNNVIIVKYDLEYFKKVSIQETFLNILNINEETISRIKPKEFLRINKSYNLAELELKRLLNNILDMKNEKLNNQLDWILQETSDRRDEEYKLFDLISDDIKRDIYNKYNDINENMISLNIIQFPTQLNNNEDVILYTFRDKINDILDVIDYIRNNEPKLITYLTKCIKTKQNNLSSHIDYEIKTLSQWFNILDIPKSSNSWFNNLILQDMSIGKYKEPDYLREITKILIERNDIVNAEYIINRAYELRPAGPAIIELRNKIKQIKGKL